MFRLKALRLPWSSGSPTRASMTRPCGRGSNGGRPCWTQKLVGRIGLALRRYADGTRTILGSEAGALIALFDSGPAVAEPRAAGRPVVARLPADGASSVDDLVAGVVHEIRNPLTAIRMWMFSIQEAVENDPDLNRRCDLVCNEISRLERLSRSFLEYTRLPEMRVRPLKVPALLDEIMDVLEPQIEACSAKVHRCDAAHVPPAMADHEQMEQVLINLLTNSAEALEGGGDIFVSTEGERGKGKGGPMVVIRVRDTGPGMPASVRERILEPLASSKHRGKGLGLYIAARITENHGGRLSIESGPAGGTTVSVRIPAACGDTDELDPDC